MMPTSFHFPSWYFAALYFWGVLGLCGFGLVHFVRVSEHWTTLHCVEKSWWFPFFLFLDGGTIEHNRRGELVIFLACHISLLSILSRLAYSFLHSGLGDKVKAKNGARKKSIRYCFVSRMQNRNNIHNLDTDAVLFAVF
jgi:hypothetical protein